MARLKLLYREVGVTRAEARGHVVVAHHLQLIGRAGLSRPLLTPHQ